MKEDIVPKKVPGEQQSETNPGSEKAMTQKPIFDDGRYIPAGKLKDKLAIVTGGDSGIGRSICIYFAKEGADVVIVYHQHDEDANDTKQLVEKEGRKCLLIKGDICDSKFCEEIINRTLTTFKKDHIDILINHAGIQIYHDKIEDISDKDIDLTFKTNIYSMFQLTREAVKHMKEGSTIVNTTSVTAFKGHDSLIDYSATKGAILTFTRSLALQLAPRKIRVNCVAPGPIWTPLIPSSFPKEVVENFGKDTPLGRPGQPCELAPSYVFLASEDSSYITGQTISVNGGTIVNT